MRRIDNCLEWHGYISEREHNGYFEYWQQIWLQDRRCHSLLKILSKANSSGAWRVCVDNCWTWHSLLNLNTVCTSCPSILRVSCLNLLLGQGYLSYKGSHGVIAHFNHYFLCKPVRWGWHCCHLGGGGSSQGCIWLWSLTLWGHCNLYDGWTKVELRFLSCCWPCFLTVCRW